MLWNGWWLLSHLFQLKWVWLGKTQKWTLTVGCGVRKRSAMNIWKKRYAQTSVIVFGHKAEQAQLNLLQIMLSNYGTGVDMHVVPNTYNIQFDGVPPAVCRDSMNNNILQWVVLKQTLVTFSDCTRLPFVIVDSCQENTVWAEFSASNTLGDPYKVVRTCQSCEGSSMSG